jgi:hypothetical protein
MDRKSSLRDAKLAELIAATTEALKARIVVKMNALAPPPNDPVDCEALLVLIQTAQQLYAENCAGGP